MIQKVVKLVTTFSPNFGFFSSTPAPAHKQKDNCFVWPNSNLWYYGFGSISPNQYYNVHVTTCWMDLKDGPKGRDGPKGPSQQADLNQEEDVTKEQESGLKGMSGGQTRY